MAPIFFNPTHTKLQKIFLALGDSKGGGGGGVSSVFFVGKN